MTKERLEEFKAEWQNIQNESITYKHSGVEMVLMSILSDVQEEIAMGLTERATDKINFVKYVLSEVKDEKGLRRSVDEALNRGDGSYRP